jgi:hypothetical protein
MTIAPGDCGKNPNHSAPAQARGQMKFSGNVRLFTVFANKLPRPFFLRDSADVHRKHTVMVSSGRSEPPLA